MSPANAISSGARSVNGGGVRAKLQRRLPLSASYAVTRWSVERTITSPRPTSGADWMSLEACARHSGLPSAPNASTSPRGVPTATTKPSLPTPAEMRAPASMRQSTLPLAGWMRTSAPSPAAA